MVIGEGCAVSSLDRGSRARRSMTQEPEQHQSAGVSSGELSTSFTEYQRALSLAPRSPPGNLGCRSFAAGCAPLRLGRATTDDTRTRRRLRRPRHAMTAEMLPEPSRITVSIQVGPGKTGVPERCGQGKPFLCRPGITTAFISWLPSADGDQNAAFELGAKQRNLGY